MKLAFDRDNQFEWQPGSHLIDQARIVLRITVSTVTQTFTLSGKYCIYKKHDCPGGFESGSITWDDNVPLIHIPGVIGDDNEDEQTYEEPVPDGSYDRNTEIKFCCRWDGFTQEAISLPSSSPFFLLRYSDECQKVALLILSEQLCIMYCMICF